MMAPCCSRLGWNCAELREHVVLPFGSRIGEETARQQVCVRLGGIEMPMCSHSEGLPAASTSLGADGRHEPCCWDAEISPGADVISKKHAQTRSPGSPKRTAWLVECRVPGPKELSVENRRGSAICNRSHLIGNQVRNREGSID